MQFTGERFLPEISGEIKYEHWHRYLLANELIKGEKVLDLACGEGYGSSLLAESAGEVTGIDIDTETIAHAKNTYSQTRKNLNFIKGSAEKIPVESGSFDAVVSFETIEHVNSPETMITEVRRVLKPNGIFIVSTPNKFVYSDHSEKNPFHLHELYLEEFYRALKNKFKSVEILGQRLSTASFIYPLVSGATDVDIYSNYLNNTRKYLASLYSPRYYLAVCSDDATRIEKAKASIFVDIEDDLHQEYGKRLSENYAGYFNEFVKTKDLEATKLRSIHETEISNIRLAHQAELADTKSAHQAELADTKSAHQAELADTRRILLNSTSWKLTKPLRWIADFIKKT
ncbi:MAG: class I SAM-dependent methyltransferase [bacterium]